MSNRKREEIEEMARKYLEGKPSTIDEIRQWFKNPTFKETMEKLSKKERAQIVYDHISKNPKLKIGEMCAIYGFTTAYFNTLRTANKEQWDEEIESRLDDDVIFMIKMAGDCNISDADWKDLYGDADRSQLIEKQ